MEYAAALQTSLQRQFHINLLKPKFSKRYNSCPECPNNTKFCPQTNFSMKILILGSISAEYADKRWLLYSKIYIMYMWLLLTLNINSQPYLLDTRLDTHAVLKHHESSSLT